MLSGALGGFMKYIIFTIFFSNLGFAGYPGAEATIPEFHLVSEGIFRGARPEVGGMQELKNLGVKTILNLENDMEAVDAETVEATQLNIQMISVPMSGFFAPSDQTANSALDILKDPANYPVFVHCQYGHDRTGLIIGLYRVLYQSWNVDLAYQEMLELGFHPNLLFPLDNYFRYRTGMQQIALSANYLMEMPQKK